MLSVVARNVYVEFPIYEGHARSLRHQLGLGRITRRFSGGDRRLHKIGGQIDERTDGKIVVHALNGIDFEIHEGDRIALMGRNGSGKTTLLRTIAGIYEPSRGTVEVAGHVTPLFNLSFGMDPDSTGIENIWVRGRMLGLTDDMIVSVLDDVTSFSELGDYLDIPIRTYSSGMLARLAFAVSTSVKPEILVLDETIGAVDTAFADRARARLDALIESTGILVLASHSIEMQRAWCNKGLVLEDGRIAFFGPFDESFASYNRILGGEAVASSAAAPTQPS